MNETEFALLELRLLKSGRPYHIHTTSDRKQFVCTSPYCKSTFEDEPQGGPGEDPQSYKHGEL
jgi:hypothetical protein